MTQRHIFILAALLVVVTSGFFNFYQLCEVPPGLWHDEAVNGISARRANDSNDLKVFYRENFGREGLHISMQALLLRVMSPSAFALRLPSAIAGVLATFFMFLLVFELLHYHEKRDYSLSLRVACFGSVLMGTTFWHVVQARIAERAIMAPLFLVAGLYFLLVSVRQKKWRLVLFGVFAGAVYGLGFYTYIAYRVTPLVVLALLLLCCRPFKKGLASFGAFLVGLAGCVTPLAMYFYEHPKHFYSRVAIVAKGQTTSDVFENFLWALRFIFAEGTRITRHGMLDQPLVPITIAILIAVGFVWEAAAVSKSGGEGRRQRLVWLALIWFVIGLLPGSFARPGSNRLILTMVPLFIMAGVGLNVIYESLKTTGGSRLFKYGVIAVILLLYSSYNYTNYFIRWRNEKRTFDGFNGHVPEVATYIQSLPVGTQVYIVGGRWWHYPAAGIKFLTGTYDRELAQDKGIRFGEKQCPHKEGTVCIKLDHISWEVIPRTPSKVADVSLGESPTA